VVRRRLLLALAGLVLGSGVTLVLSAAFGGDREPATTVTAAPSTTAPAAWWVSPDEIPLGPAVLVIEGLRIEDREAVVDFALFDLSPVGPGSFREPDYHTSVPLERLAEEAAVAPQSWTLITAAGEIPGTTSSPRGRTARFPLPAGDLPEVLGLRLNRYWMRIPYASEVGLPSGTVLELDDGLSLSMGRVIPQTNSTIVQIDLFGGGGFATTSDPGAVLLGALGDGWTFTSGRTATGLQLVHGPGEVPDPLLFAVRSAYWVPFDRPVLIDVGALRLG